MAGFGGLRDHGGKMTFAPRLPARLDRLAFRLVCRGRRLRIDVTKTDATYVLLEGDPLELEHHGTAITVSAQDPVTEPIPPPPSRPAPSQPRGRAPARRGAEER